MQNLQQIFSNQSRSFLLGDYTGMSVEVTMWQEKCELLQDVLEGSLIALKNVRVSEFSGLITLLFFTHFVGHCLSSTASTTLALDPQCLRQHADRIREWYHLSFFPFLLNIRYANSSKGAYNISVPTKRNANWVEIASATDKRTGFNVTLILLLLTLTYKSERMQQLKEELCLFRLRSTLPVLSVHIK